MLRIAHVSDLHVLSPLGFEWREALFNKRLTGYANLIRQRGRVYRHEYLATVLSAAAKHADHLVVTGDITNLSLEKEFEQARALLDGAARTIEVTVVPGNHDVYLPSIHHDRRFPHHFGAFLRGDLPELACDLPSGPFPCVKLRGPAAIIALSSAVPRPPFVASGRVGDAQLAALAEVLAHPEVVGRRRQEVSVSTESESEAAIAESQPRPKEEGGTGTSISDLVPQASGTIVHDALTQGFGWVIVGLGVLADIATYSGGGYGNRRRLPGYSQTPPQV